jgi:hypothetical protein
VAIVAQIPIRSLRSKTLRFLVSKPRRRRGKGCISSRRESRSCPGPRMTAWRRNVTAVHAIGYPLVNFITKLASVPASRSNGLKRPNRRLDPTPNDSRAHSEKRPQS